MFSLDMQYFVILFVSFHLLDHAGEITLWCGVFLVGASAFHGASWLCALSPLFVIVLLTKVSGVPMLEEKSDEKWGGQADYEAYKRRTPILFPLGVSCGAKDAKPKAPKTDKKAM